MTYHKFEDLDYLISNFFWNEGLWKFSDEEFERAGQQGHVFGLVQCFVVVIVDFKSIYNMVDGKFEFLIAAKMQKLLSCK